MTDVNEVYRHRFNFKKAMKLTPVTFSIIGINVLVFIMVYVTDAFVGRDWLVNHFSKITYNISVDHEYYRLLTAVFVHKEPMHIFFNMMALYFLGRPIELIFKKTRFLILYLISGLFGTLGSFIFSPHAAIGASGAVFGIFGLHVYLFIKNREAYLKLFNKDVLQLLVINIFIGFVIPNIDYWGHLGGLLGGFLVATTFGLSRQASFIKSIIVGSAISLIIFISGFLYFNHAYESYVTSIDSSLNELNQAIQDNNVMKVITIRDEMLDSKPKFPPVSDETMYTEINNIILQMK
ncbi:MAG: rhomboid family intramembrane serine protease [Clostridia bacterium]|nr:rhomboid family intramembrane serine protease [Clostridia bacterium]